MAKPSLFLHRISVVRVYLSIAATTQDPAGQDPSQTLPLASCTGVISGGPFLKKRHGNVTEQTEGGGGYPYTITERIPLSLSGGTPHTHTPTRFAMPAARGKTSLNARDW